MTDVLRFWMDRGVDGFRIDVLWHIVKAEGLPDNPLNPAWTPAVTERDRVIQRHSTDQPEAHALAAGFRALADRYAEETGEPRLLVGEIFLPDERLVRWYGTADQPGIHLPFNFHLIEQPWDAAVLGRVIAAYEGALPAHGWPNWVIGSHDAARIAARVGERQARVAAMLLLTLRGTPTLYQGDEIGIGRVDIPHDRIRDPQDLRQPGLGIGRDRSRTPMAWDDGPHAGFSTAEPWLPLHPDWPTRNVAAQARDAASMLHLYRALLHLRRAEPALSVGGWAAVPAADHVLAYERQHGAARRLVALNFSQEARPVPLPAGVRARVLLSTAGDGGDTATLRPDEGMILALETA